MLLSRADAMKAVNKKRAEKIELKAFVNKAWTKQFNAWASFRKPDLKAIEIAGGIASELTREIEIMYNSEVRKGWRVIWGNKTFDILHTYSYGTETTILICREVVQ